MSSHALTVAAFAFSAAMLALLAFSASEKYGESARVFDIRTMPYFIGCALAALRVEADGMAGAFACIVALAALAVCAATDAQCGYIFDRVTVIAGASVLFLGWFGGLFATALAGAGCAGGALMILWLLSGGRGIGLGDVKLAVTVGAMLGPVLSLAALGAAFVLGASFVTFELFARRVRLGDTVRFAPYMCSGVILVTALRGTLS